MIKWRIALYTGIVIAFPQRDVHLGTKGPIEVKVLPGDRGGLPET